MTGECCVAGRAPHRLVRRLSRVTASILPTAVLAFLPKCPVCLAGWLTVATGVSFSAAGAAWVRGLVVVLGVAVIALAAAPLRLRRAPSPLGRLHGSATVTGDKRQDANNQLRTRLDPERWSASEDRTIFNPAPAGRGRPAQA